MSLNKRCISKPSRHSSSGRHRGNLNTARHARRIYVYMQQKMGMAPQVCFRGEWNLIEMLKGDYSTNRSTKGEESKPRGVLSMNLTTVTPVTTPPAQAGGFFWKTSFNSGFLRDA
jgi:hypothetical protein